MNKIDDVAEKLSLAVAEQMKLESQVGKTAFEFYLGGTKLKAIIRLICFLVLLPVILQVTNNLFLVFSCYLVVEICRLQFEIRKIKRLHQLKDDIEIYKQELDGEVSNN